MGIGEISGAIFMELEKQTARNMLLFWILLGIIKIIL
jgi:hypothetical protein